MNNKLAIITLAGLSLFTFWTVTSNKFSAEDGNVDLTVPSSVNVVLNEDGSNSISDFYVENNMLVEAYINSIDINEINGWEFVEKEDVIPVDKKQFSLSIEGNELLDGNNNIEITLPESQTTKLDIDIKRGAFNNPLNNERALDINMNYFLGLSDFTASFDSDGGSEVADIVDKNGSTFTFPSTQKDYYDFIGWKNASNPDDTKLYQAGETFKMPMRDIHFVAQWKAHEVEIRYPANGGTRYIDNNEEISTPDPIYVEKNNFDYLTDANGISSFDDGSNLQMKRTGYKHPGLDNEWIANNPASGIIQGGTGNVTFGDVARNAGKDEELKVGNVVVDLYANWILDTYSISYDLGGGEFNPNDNIKNQYTFEDESYSIKEPTRVGYDFARWNET